MNLAAHSFVKAALRLVWELLLLLSRVKPKLNIRRHRRDPIIARLRDLSVRRLDLIARRLDLSVRRLDLIAIQVPVEIVA